MLSVLFNLKFRVTIYVEQYYPWGLNYIQFQTDGNVECTFNLNLRDTILTLGVIMSLFSTYGYVELYYPRGLCYVFFRLMIMGSVPFNLNLSDT